jgi:hypothetical protein
VPGFYSGVTGLRGLEAGELPSWAESNRRHADSLQVASLRRPMGIAPVALPALPACLEIFPPPDCFVTIDTVTLPEGRVGEPYYGLLGARYGPDPLARPFGGGGRHCSALVTWRLRSGPLPPGLELLPGGALGGVPTEGGAFPCIFDAQAEDSGERLELTITILERDATAASWIGRISQRGRGSSLWAGRILKRALILLDRSRVAPSRRESTRRQGRL